MLCIMQNLKKKCKGQHTLSQIKTWVIGVKLTFLEGKLGRFLMLAFLKLKFLNLLHFESGSESRFNSDENCF